MEGLCNKLMLEYRWGWRSLPAIVPSVLIIQIGKSKWSCQTRAADAMGWDPRLWFAESSRPWEKRSQNSYLDLEWADVSLILLRSMFVPKKSLSGMSAGVRRKWMDIIVSEGHDVVLIATMEKRCDILPNLDNMSAEVGRKDGSTISYSWIQNSRNCSM